VVTGDKALSQDEGMTALGVCALAGGVSGNNDSVPAVAHWNSDRHSRLKSLVH
jgi:hypothetical protein